MCSVCSVLQHPANRTHNPQLVNAVSLLKGGRVEFGPGEGRGVGSGG